MTKSLEDRLAAVEKSNAEISARLQVLEDVREINELFRRWNYACTGGFRGIPSHRPEGLDIFADDGGICVSWLHGEDGGPRGREELEKYFHPYLGDEGLIPLAFQTALDHGVEVDGDTATQKLSLLILMQFREGAPPPSPATPVLMMARYTNQYVRTADGWRVKRFNIEGGFRVPVEKFIPMPHR